MNLETEDLDQQVLLDHSKHPRNFGDLPSGAVHFRTESPSCGDEIDLYVRFNRERAVEEIRFTGHGCAICIASASLMTVKLKALPFVDAVALVHAFHSLVTDHSAPIDPALGDLQILRGVRHFPQRVKCALLPWQAFRQAVRHTMATGVDSR